MEKNAVQIEIPEINILQKNGEKSFFTFRGKLYLKLIIPDNALPSFCHS